MGSYDSSIKPSNDATDTMHVVGLNTKRKQALMTQQNLFGVVIGNGNENRVFPHIEMELA